MNIYLTLKLLINKLKKKQIYSSELGAVTIEALVFIIMLMTLFVGILIVGTGYWNLTVLNSAVNSASLASATLAKADCPALIGSPNPKGNCPENYKEIVETIRENSESQLIHFVNDPKNNKDRPVIEATTDFVTPKCSALNLPAQSGGGSLNTPGWGYSYIEFKANFSPLFNSSIIPIKASSISFSFDPVCTSNAP